MINFSFSHVLLPRLASTIPESPRIEGDWKGTVRGQVHFHLLGIAMRWLHAFWMCRYLNLDLLLWALLRALANPILGPFVTL